MSVVLGIEDRGLQQEVLDFLGRHPRIEISASMSDADASGEWFRNSDASVRVLCPSIAARLASGEGRGHITFVVTEDLTVASLRTAIRAGAQAVFHWPGERDDLASAIPAFGAPRAAQDLARGRVIAIAGSRGGAGVTFIATHLAAATAGRGQRPVLIDADPANADLTAALGILPDEEARTIADLVPVLEELSPDHLNDVLYQHQRGFPVLLGPAKPDDALTPGVYRGAVALLALEYDPVLVHVARPGEGSARDVMGLADAIVLVTPLDLLSIYGARRVMAALTRQHPSPAWVPVINRATRSPLTPKDIERALGVAPAIRIRLDSRVRRAQERGRLLPANARGAGRDIRKLADLVTRAAGGPSIEQGSVT